MKKLLILLPIALLACLCPLSLDLQPIPGAWATLPGFSTQTPMQTVQLRTGNGQMSDQIQAHVLRAAGLGLAPFVEFNAKW